MMKEASQSLVDFRCLWRGRRKKVIVCSMASSAISSAADSVADSCKRAGLQLRYYSDRFSDIVPGSSDGRAVTELLSAH
jgi:hypothetical protein